MQLLVLAAAIINAKRPAAPDNKYWDDVVALPQVVNGVLLDTRQTVTQTKTVTLGTGRFGGQCMQIADGQMYAYGNTPFVLAGDFTFEGHAYFTGNGDNDYLFDTGGNGLVLKLVGNQWKVAYGGSAQPLIDTTVSPQNNRWYHFAVVRQNGVMRLYVDGVALGLPSNFTTILNQPYFSWGNYTFGSAYSHIGKLDCCRISSMARYTSNFTPLLEPFPVGGPEAGFDPYWGQTALLTKDSAVDATGKGTFVTVGANATISTTQKRFGVNSMKVSGGSHFRMANSDGRFDFETADFTVEGWVYPLAVMGGEVHVAGRSATGSAGGYRIVLSDMRPRIYYSALGATGWTATAPIASSDVPINRWTHLALTRSGNVLKLFVNGKLLVTQVFGGTMAALTLPFTIGASSSSTEGFNGHIDSVRVTRACRYTESFTPKLVADYAQRADAGGEGLSGYDTYLPNTLMQVPFDGTIGPRHTSMNVVDTGASYTFDNVRKLFNKPTISWVTGNFAFINYSATFSAIPSTDFTVESWVNSDFNGAADFGIASQWGTGGWGLTLRQGLARFYYTSTLFIQSTSNIAQGDWKHIAVTRRNGVITLFVNGVAEASVNYAGVFNISTPVQIGKLGTAASTTGYRVNMAELRITNGFSRYNTNFATPSKPFPVSGLAA
jgi:hypothetical protein